MTTLTRFGRSLVCKGKATYSIVFEPALFDMKFSSSVVFLIFVSGFVLAGDSVLELTDNDFKDRVGEYETVLVMFYAPW